MEACAVAVVIQIVLRRHAGELNDHMVRRKARAVFFISGFGAATWAPLIPVLREKLSIGEDTLGMLLLALGIGSSKFTS